MVTTLVFNSMLHPMPIPRWQNIIITGLTTLLTVIFELMLFANAYSLYSHGETVNAYIQSVEHASPSGLKAMIFPSHPHNIIIDGTNHRLLLNEEYNPGNTCLFWNGRDNARAVICDDNGHYHWVELFGGWSKFLITLGGLLFLYFQLDWWFDELRGKHTTPKH